MAVHYLPVPLSSFLLANVSMSHSSGEARVLAGFQLSYAPILFLDEAATFNIRRGAFRTLLVVDLHVEVDGLEIVNKPGESIHVRSWS